MRRSIVALLACVGLAAASPALADYGAPGGDPGSRLAQIDGAIAGGEGDPSELARERADVLIRLDRLDEAEREIVAMEAALAPGDKATEAELALLRSVLHAQRQQNADAIVHARRALALREEVHGEESANAAATRFNLAKLLISSGAFDEALPMGERAWTRLRELRPVGDSERFDAGFQYAVGLVFARQAQQAEAVLRTLLGEMGALTPAHPMRAKLPSMLGTELLMQGRSTEALPYLAQSVEQGLRVQGLFQGERADHLSTYGIALLMMDRPDDALPILEQSAALFGETAAVASQSGAYLNAGTAADRAGDRAKGLEYRERGMELAAGAGEQHPLAVALNQFKLAQSLAHVGRLEEAEAMEAEAVEAIAMFRPANHFQRLNSRIALGWIKALRGDAQGGLELVKPAFRATMQGYNELEIAQNRVIDVLSDVEAFSHALETARLAGDLEFAFEVMQVMIESDASRAAVAVSQREQAGEGPLGVLLKRRQEAGAAVAAADSALLRVQAEEGDEAEPREALEAARAGLAALDEELDTVFPQFRELLRPRLVTLAELVPNLAADEAVLLVDESDLGVYTLAITREGAVLARSSERRQELRGLVARLRASIDEGLQGGPAESFDTATAKRLHDAVFTPDIARAVAGKGALRLATGDILSAVPFSVLVSEPGASVARSRFLIDDKAISILPSLAALRDNTLGGGAVGRLVAIGAPSLSGSEQPGAGASYFAPGTTRAAQVAQLQPLPGAAEEMRRVASLLEGGGTPLVLAGGSATEPAVKALDLRDVGVLLFATHGLVGGTFDARSEPALVLTPPALDTPDDDGLLTASEVAALDIGAEWVILSACDTAAGGRPSAAAYTGLARGFLFAGARRVVASHWPVRDDISARLSVGIVEAASEGAEAGEALRQAVLAVKRDEPHPAMWAPFMVVAR